MYTVKDLAGHDVPALPANRVQNHLDHLMGKALTIVEASTPDKEQRKALRSILRSAFTDKMNEIHAEAYSGAVPAGVPIQTRTCGAEESKCAAAEK